MRAQCKVQISKERSNSDIGFQTLRLVLGSFDTTVWPSNATAVANATTIAAQLCGMSSAVCVFVQLPLCHTQTTVQAMLKHRHQLETVLLKQSLTVQYSVQVLYTKEDSRANDSRPLCQPSLCTFHSNYTEPVFGASKAVRQGKLGPCPLIKVSDFINYDDSNKPGASARCEQNLGCQQTRFLSLNNSNNHFKSKMSIVNFLSW